MRTKIPKFFKNRYVVISFCGLFGVFLGIIVALTVFVLKDERKILVLFQNNHELRPTGGFLTGYSVLDVKLGKLGLNANDMYNLDSKYIPHVNPPAPFSLLVSDPYGGEESSKFRLRDMNWSPDFSESMELVLRESASLGLGGVDSVVAIDTQALLNILEALGPITISGYGDFTTDMSDECDCPQAIYALEDFADTEGAIVYDPLDPTRIIHAPPNYDNRKRIIGPLTKAILKNTLLRPYKLPALIGALRASLVQKHILFYSRDKNFQRAFEKRGIAGRVKEYDKDYLYIVDANLGGRKSNLYVTQEVEQVVKIEDGAVTKMLTITYQNPRKYDGWLNSVLPNWTRIYVPKGSELISLEGLDNKVNYEEFGKTVFAGSFELRPEGLAKVVLAYKLPFKVSGNYSLYIQKQPGIKSPLYTLSLGDKLKEIYLEGDTEVNFGT